LTFFKNRRWVGPAVPTAIAHRRHRRPWWRLGFWFLRSCRWSFSRRHNRPGSGPESQWHKGVVGRRFKAPSA
jgi:hypothetical protein